MLLTSYFSFTYYLLNKFQFSVSFIFLSANAFNLDHTEKLLFGKELIFGIKYQSLSKLLTLTLTGKAIKSIVKKGENTVSLLHYFLPFCSQISSFKPQLIFSNFIILNILNFYHTILGFDDLEVEAI